MLSVRALGNLGTESAAARAVSNYFKDAYSDYYVKDLDENFAGDWCGRGTEAMYLVREVDKQTLTAALSGKVAGKEVKNAGQEDRQMGWDLTFSAPKSVSLAWAFADNKHKKEIEKAHMEASRWAFGFIEEKITTRLGQGGRIRQTALISAASFLHFTSRQGDPQIHSHFVIPNLSIGRDGKIRTIVSKQFYTYKMTVGAFYQAELCMQMQKLGYRIEEGVKGTFRLSSVDRNTERTFSKRSEEINLMAAKLGADFYVAQRGVVLLTRPSKTYTTLEERSNVWGKEVKTFGLKTNFKRWSDDQTPSTNINHAEIFKKIKSNLTEKSSYFQEKDILLEIAKAYQGITGIKGIQKVYQVFMQHSYIVVLGINKNRSIVYSTVEMQEVEKEILSLTTKINKEKFPKVAIDKSQVDWNKLSDEHKQAIKTATNEFRLVVIEGKAGTGKTTTLRNVKDIYEKSGIQVEGVSFTGRAANELQIQSNIKSKTIHSWLNQTEFIKNSVLVVDEAGLIGSRQLYKMLKKAEMNNSKVILVGDPKQLQPIEAGGPLYMIDKRLARENSECYSQLHTIKRQKHEWMREVVSLASIGATNKALEIMHKNNKIDFYKTPKQARENLISDYIKENIKENNEKAKNAIILTNRVSDSNMINKEVRDQLKSKGIVESKGIIFETPEKLMEVAVGDRVMFTRNNYKKSLEVSNGQVGTVIKIDSSDKKFSIQLDSGIKKEVDTNKYNHLDYGWSMTTYKAQGATVEKAYVFGYSNDHNASQQATYVQISRAKEDTKLYVVGGEVSVELPIREYESPFEAEEKKKLLKSMEKTWGRDGTKFTSVDISSRLKPYPSFSYYKAFQKEDPKMDVELNNYN